MGEGGGGARGEKDYMSPDYMPLATQVRGHVGGCHGDDVTSFSRHFSVPTDSVTCNVNFLSPLLRSMTRGKMR